MRHVQKPSVGLTYSISYLTNIISLSVLSLRLVVLRRTFTPTICTLFTILVLHSLTSPRRQIRTAFHQTILVTIDWP